MLLVSGRRLFVLLAALCGLTLATGASAATINFSGLGANGSAISQDHGDSADLDISYATIGGDGGSLGIWNDGYHGANGVVYATCETCVGQITLAPSAGMSIVLDSISTHSFGSGRNSSLTVFNEDFSQVLYTSSFRQGTSRDRAIGVASSGPLHIQWGADAYNVGIGSLTLSMVAVPQSVPEPALALLLAPAGLMALRRMRARA